MSKVLLATISLFIFHACGGGSGNSYDSSEAVVESVPQEVYEEISLKKSVDQTNNTPIEQKIIKTGNLSFETTDIEQTFQLIQTQVKQLNGYIQNDRTSRYGERYERSLSVRIPVTRFESFVDTLEQHVKVFDQKEINAQDVTEEFVDLQARLKAKRALEERYLQLLAKANNIKDMLEIERQLAQIREEIEAREGRLKYLEKQVAFSTLHISFYEMVSVKHAPSQSYFNRMGRALSGGFNGLGEFFLLMLRLWPMWLIGIGLLIFVRKRMKSKKMKK
jgi:hypothetical protein